MQIASTETLKLPMIKLVHAQIPGRIRIEVPNLYRNDSLAKWIVTSLLHQPDVHKINANALTGRVLIVHKTSQKAKRQVLAMLEQSLKTFPISVPPGKGMTPFSQRTETNGLLWHTLSASSAARSLKSNLSRGLFKSQVQINQIQYGSNLLTQIPGRSQLSILIHQFKNLPTSLLVLSAVLSFATGGMGDAFIIALVLILNCSIGYTMENSSEKLIHDILHPHPSEIRVIRDGRTLTILPWEIVVGDILVLDPGMIIPADGRVARANALTIDEASLTGESIPVAKTSQPLSHQELRLADRRNMIFRGTSVTGGTGLAIITATGDQTEIGRIQHLVQMESRPETPLEGQLNRLGKQLVLTALGASVFVVILGILRRQNLLSIIKSSVSMTVAVIPESLPTVSVTTLARGIKELKKEDILVRHLSAIETLASVQHICLDKTGTLTMNQMEVTEVRSVSQTYQVTSHGLKNKDRSIAVNRFPSLNQLIEVAILCNEAEISPNEGSAGHTSVRIKGKSSKDPYETRYSNGTSTESALLRLGLVSGVNPVQVRKNNPWVSTQYRSENQPYMVTEHRYPDSRKWLAVKGSPKEVLSLCTHYSKGTRIYPITHSILKKILSDNTKMASQGLRVLGFASGQEKTQLTWLGLVGMVDPIRKGIKDLIPRFMQAGIETSMITGDQIPTANAIARNIGIENVYARVSPSDKLRIVQSIQNSNANLKRKVVAMIGDGINDAPALRSADIGIAMSARGSETATQVADVILPSDNLQGLLVAIEQGRTIHQDIKKAIDYVVSKNLSEVLFTLISVVLGREQPLSPIQFLWLNMVTDTLPELALAQEPPASDVLRDLPQKYKTNLLSRDDLPRITTDVIALTLAPLLSYSNIFRKFNNPQRANTAAFLTMTGSSLLYTLSARSPHSRLLFRDKIPKNPAIQMALGIGLAAQVLGVAAPPLKRALSIHSGWKTDWMIDTVGSVFPILMIELAKLGNQTVGIHNKGE